MSWYQKCDRTRSTRKFDAASTTLTIVEETGGLPALELELERMTTRFYNDAFLDDTLDKFIGSHDDLHADRFARWIHQKLTGSSVWDEGCVSRSDTPITFANGRDIVVTDRSSSHVAAWHSPKRHPQEAARHFLWIMSSLDKVSLLSNERSVW